LKVLKAKRVAQMNPITLGPPMHCEGSYRVREVLGANQQPEGFTFDGPGFNALIIYPSFQEALAAVQSLAAQETPKDDRPTAA